MKKKLVIYGTGKYGKSLYHILKSNDVEILCFLQNNVEKETLYEGIPVLAVRDFVYDFEKVIVLLAVADSYVRVYAKSILLVKGVKERDIFDCTHFIEDNCLKEALDEEKERYCLLCGKRIKEFLPAGEDIEIFKKHYIIGGGKRNNAVCPICGCLDRNRWCMYALERYTEILNKPCTVLHFAPEEGIANLIRTNRACIYYSADIVRTQAMLQMDLTDILFKDLTFDYIIVNHVLEHVSDEEAAIRELKRVLKDDGIIVMSFPICTDQKTYEDTSVVTKEDRKRYFGQEDHVRLYGIDYKERLEAYGFVVEVKTPIQVLTCSEIEKYGFIKDDVILFCRIAKL